MGLAGPTLAPPGLPERLRRSDPAGGHGPRAGSGPAGRGLAPYLPDLVLGAGLPGLSPSAPLSPWVEGWDENIRATGGIFQDFMMVKGVPRRSNPNYQTARAHHDVYSILLPGELLAAIMLDLKHVV